MVHRHWGFTADPFAAGSPPFVATPGHAEAVARLSHAIDTAEHLAILRAPSGLGKSTVLREALERSKGPGRRLSLVRAPLDGPDLLASLTQGLGGRRFAGRSAAWRGLADAAKLCRFQGLAVVLAVDDSHALDDPADRQDLGRLAHLDPHPAARLTVILAGREDLGAEPSSPWGLLFRLAPLSRGEAAAYLDAKLAAVGRLGATFTPRAVALLHATSGGNPRGLDRLASLALMAGALRGLEVVGPDVIEGVSRECVGAA